MLKILKGIIPGLLLFISFSCSIQKSTLLSFTAPLSSKSFQANFLNELIGSIDVSAKAYLQQFLQQVNCNGVQHGQQCREAQAPTVKLEQQILFVKQLLDLQEPTLASQTLRNVNFLRKLKQLLQQMQSETAAELRRLRMFEVCQQFRSEQQQQQQQFKSIFPANNPPYANSTKLMPLIEVATTQTLQQTNISIHAAHFGRQLYEAIKISGCEIIDDYLNMLAELLQQVLDETPDTAERATSKIPEPVAIKKLLNEIVAIRNINDFYDKRQRLYFYLQYKLPQDFDNFQNTASSQQDLVHIFHHIKERGMNLFVSFLFSNFEFLERSHNEWSKLLPAGAALTDFKEDSQIFYKIQQHYRHFKQEQNNNNYHYDSYMQELGNLANSTADIGEHAHIFQLLHSASENLGGVTLNIIREKCQEL